MRNIEKIKIGDLVTTDHVDVEGNVVRRITGIVKNEKYGSGYGISADGGEPCKTCGKLEGTPIDSIDADWFKVKYKTKV